MIEQLRKQGKLRGSGPNVIPPDNAGTSDDVDMAPIGEGEPRPRIDNPHVDPVPPDDGGISAGVALFASSGRGGRTDGSESSVDPFRHWMYRPYTETQNSILPYRYIGSGTCVVPSGANAASQVSSYSFRLNSPYDILTTTTYSADPAPAADTADGTVQTAQMFTFWSALYRYWTVVACHYNVHVWLNDQGNDQEMSVWIYHNGQQQPPLIADASNVVTDLARETHRHTHLKTLRLDRTDTGKSIYNGGIHFSGEYRPGNYTVHNDVAEDEYKETWHRTTEVPSLREVCTVIVNRSDRQRAIYAGSDVTFRYVLEITYKVQWKDLKADFQYPTQLTDFSAITDAIGIA
ncbi:hypothetical protein AC1031_011659 [Aphanomyces cochlioides]|nr:hypothetical protein AC1031_011659 [Aphanomyces cochlioides]